MPARIFFAICSHMSHSYAQFLSLPPDALFHLV